MTTSYALNAMQKVEAIANKYVTTLENAPCETGGMYVGEDYIEITLTWQLENPTMLEMATTTTEIDAYIPGNTTDKKVEWSEPDNTGSQSITFICEHEFETGGSGGSASTASASTSDSDGSDSSAGWLP